MKQFLLVLLLVTLCACNSTQENTQVDEEVVQAISPFTLEMQTGAVEIVHNDTETEWEARWYDVEGNCIAFGNAEKYDVDGNLYKHENLFSEEN